MASDTSDDVKNAFGLKASRQEAAQKLNKNEFKTYEQIKRTIDGVRQTEEQKYKNEYKARVDAATLRITNKAGAKTRAFKPPWARDDKFNPTANIRQAQREVEDQHHKVMAVLDQQETQQIDRLIERSQYRTQQREKPMRDFKKAVDRRKGPDRRQRS